MLLKDAETLLISISHHEIKLALIHEANSCIVGHL